ncbi:MAG: peptidase MA family metallohydrolase, partial [bacterium]
KGWFIPLFFFFIFLPKITLAEFNHPELRWKVIETPHFLIHYHQEEETFAYASARIAEEIYPRITSDLGYQPSRKTPIIIENYNDTTGGYTSTLTGKIVIQAQSDPTQGSGDLSWAREVIAHEFTHAVTFAAIQESVFPLRRLMANLVLPMWFVEGLAQYEGEEEHSLKRMVVGDEARQRGIMSEADLAAFYFFEGWGRTSGYYQSDSFVRYIFQTYGKDKIAGILTHFRSQPIYQLLGQISLTTGEVALYPLPQFLSFDEALKSVVGKDSSTLYAEWRNWIMGKYSKEKEPTPDPFLTPESLLTSQGRKNMHPVFSPSEDKIAFTSDRGYDYAIFDLYLMDLKTNTVKRLDKKVNPYISFSPDGSKIVYSKTQFFAPERAFLSDLYLINIKTQRKRRLTYGLRARQPGFSPSGDQIVFVRQEGGNSNLYLLEIKTGKVFSLTNHHDGLTQNFSPSFSPDGEKIVFASFRRGKRDIYLLDLKERISSPLTLDNADDRCPVFSPDGSKVYFISNRKDGVFNLYSVDLVTKRFKQYTRVRGGVFEPAISSDGERVVLSAYEAQRFSLYLLPLKPLSEEELTPFEPKRSPKIIAEYPRDKENRAVDLSLSSNPYRPRLRLHYLLPWVSVSPDGYYISLDAYASDTLEKHNVYFSTLLTEGFQYDLAYVNREFGPTLWGEVYKLRRSSGALAGLSYSLTDKQTLGLFFHTESGESGLFLSPESWRGRMNRIKGIWQFANLTPTSDPGLERSGRSLYLGAEYSGKDIGSELNYTAYEAGGIEYKRFKNNRSLALRLLGRKIKNREEKVKVLVSLGGVNSLRGYPRDYLEGENLLLSSLEYRFLWVKRIGGSPNLYLDRLGAALFYDAGDAWNKKFKLKRSWGAEFRLRILPFGKYSLILRLGIAWPLDWEKEEARVFLAVGGVF